MKRLPLLFFLSFIVSCQQSSQTIPLSEKADTKVVEKDTVSEAEPDYYTISHSLGDVDSNSLLFPDRIVQHAKSIMSEAKELMPLNQGIGDCAIKVRRFVKDLDTLTIKKHNCGEYGFGSVLVLTQKDSLKLVAEYHVNVNVDEKRLTYSDYLRIAEFKKEESNVTESSMAISDWTNLNLNRSPGKTEHFVGKNSFASNVYWRWKNGDLKDQ